VPTREAHPLFPVWTPDGRRAIFSAPGGGFSRLSSVPVDASEPSIQLKGEVPMTAQEVPGSWTPDGRILAYTRLDEQGLAVWQLRIEDGTPKRTELLPPEGERAAGRRVLYLMPALSPDGGWLASVSSESGGYEVYVERFPEMTDRRQISRSGGYAPVWRGDGRELFYLVVGPPRRMMSVQLRLDGRLAAGEPRTLFEVADELLTARSLVPPYDASPDGRRFIFAQRQTGPVPAPPSQMHVVLNWLAELKQKVPVR
jgi:eukaryotic-like serine/threonine-protein kinase